jgi:hypothetical protein
MSPPWPKHINPKVSISQMLKGKCHPYLSNLFVYIRYSLKPRIYALVTETMTPSNVGTARGVKSYACGYRYSCLCTPLRHMREGRSFLIFTLDEADDNRHGPAILFPKKQSTLRSKYQACWTSNRSVCFGQEKRPLAMPDIVPRMASPKPIH